MPLKVVIISLLAFLPPIGWASNPIHYQDDIKPILRRHCLKCHGEDEQKAGLNMQQYQGLMKGGSGGPVVVAGRSSQSLLLEVITEQDDEARMPPNKPMLPEEEIKLIRNWIDQGVLEKAGDTSNLEIRDTGFVPSSSAEGKPAHPSMPSQLPKVASPTTLRPLPILAMATSPWAPLLAVAAQEQVQLWHTQHEQAIGGLAFPEGLPQVLRFSRDGAVLMVAGGRPVESGCVVLFEVSSGKRLVKLGDELDAVLAGDLSPDQSLVAFGGSSDVVKVFSTSQGQEQYRLTQHSDWITAIAFSPDGTTLATADRAGGLHLWDVATGGIRLSLLEHETSIRALDWRSDSKVLASAGEDGRVIWWDVKDGWPSIQRNEAHPPDRPEGHYGKLPNGVLAARFGKQGHLATAGRNQTITLWSPVGDPLQSFALESALPISTAIAHDSSKLMVGGSDGSLTFWPLDEEPNAGRSE